MYPNDALSVVLQRWGFELHFELCDALEALTDLIPLRDDKMCLASIQPLHGCGFCDFTRSSPSASKFVLIDFNRLAPFMLALTLGDFNNPKAC